MSIFNTYVYCIIPHAKDFICISVCIISVNKNVNKKSTLKTPSYDGIGSFS